MAKEEAKTKGTVAITERAYNPAQIITIVNETPEQPASNNQATSPQQPQPTPAPSAQATVAPAKKE